jgi:hypothetical protein
MNLLLVITNLSQILRNLLLYSDILKLIIFNQIEFIDGNNQLLHSHRNDIDHVSFDLATHRSIHASFKLLRNCRYDQHTRVSCMSSSDD